MACKLPFKVFSGESSEYLAKKICHSLDCELGNCNKIHFSDGEFAVSYEETVRGCYVYIVQSTFPNSDNLMELLLLIDAAKRASADKIIAVIPYFGWARQDRKDKPRVSIAAKLIADLLSTAGIDRLITMDLHADQIQGFFNIPVDHLYASTIFIPFIKNLKLKNLVIASPDVGGSKRANSYAKHLGVPLVLCHKTREKANEISSMRIIGDVDGKNVIIVDDMADTAGTLAAAANLMVDNSAASVRAIVTHPVMSGNAEENVMNSKMTELICTDSIPFDTAKCPKVRVISIADIFADTISSVYNNTSISKNYLL
ncbi:MAG: ribose-phosphate pyrophosphokinase [Prevotellaceae bacterium]|jgi:ribose-phosphate pyrophosphokinase|nr:ribose-phosphate pyrophosphokinase [Prevotellaceae bacterium]